MSGRPPAVVDQGTHTHARINSSAASARSLGGGTEADHLRDVVTSDVADSADNDKLAYPLPSGDDSPVKLPLDGAPASPTLGPLEAAFDGRRDSAATTRPSHLRRTSSASPNLGSSPTPPPVAANFSAASSSAAANKRRSMVAQFIRSGESNIVFREKAPSIVQNETGVFHAPLSARASHARATSFSVSERAGFMPIPISGLGAPTRHDSSGGGNTPTSAGNSPPRRSSTAGIGNVPMGISSRQLMFQLGSSASNSSPNAAAAVAAASQGQLGKHRRGSSAINGGAAFPGPSLIQRGESRNSDEGSGANSPRGPTRRISAFNSTAKDARSSPRLRPFGSKRTDRITEDEETRRRDAEREANILAPFLEARGDEDFVTYDLTRQQDYHRQRKEVTKEKFRRWARAHSRKPSQVEMEVDAGAAGGIQDEDDRPLVREEPSDDEPSDDDDVGDDGSRGPWYRRCTHRARGLGRRCVHRAGGIGIIRFTVGMFISLQSWIICGLIGAVTGLLASLVDIAVQWLIDLKSGYCNDALYLSNAFCCAGYRQWSGMSAAGPLLMNCPQWTSWDSNGSISSISSMVSPFFAGYLMYVLLGISMACISAWLVIYFAPHAAGSGIPEIKTILGGVIIKRFLGAWTILIKCIALVLSVGSGLSIGKEGCFVHIACCVANILCRFFPEFKNNQFKKNEAISAGAAAGISVAFGAPVGGVLFALEDVSSYFSHKTMWRAFFSSIIASMVVQSIDPYSEGRLVLFGITYVKPWYWFEMVPFAIIGVMGGLLGALFIRLNTRVAEFRKSSILRHYPILEVGMVVAVTVVVKYLSAYLRGSHNAVLASLFGDCEAPPFYDPLGMCDEDSTGEIVGSLLLTAGATFVFTSFTWSLCVPGGVFLPSLIVGAALGRVVGTVMRNWQSSSYAIGLFGGCEEFTPGIYALVGAASMLGGVTRMTVCLVVIMFEITGGLLYLLPIMVGLMFSKLVGDAFDRRSIFEAHLVLNKYPFLNSKDRIPPKICVADVMSRELLALPMHGHTVESLTDQLSLLGELRITGFPIVTTLKDRFIVGYINRSELHTGLCLALRNPTITPQTRCYFAMLSLRFPRNDPYVDLRPWLHPSPIQVVEHTPLHRVHDMFKKMGLRMVLVSRFGRLVGLLTKKDILSVVTSAPKRKDKQNTKALASSAAADSQRVNSSKGARRSSVVVRDRASMLRIGTVDDGGHAHAAPYHLMQH